MQMNKYQEARLEAAIVYAQRGWRVLPVGVDKKPLNHNGSHGATTNTAEITRWLTERSFANIGIATGPESFFVVDIDKKDGKDGQRSLKDKFQERLHFPTDMNLSAKTPSGGVHLPFEWPAGMEIHNAQGVLPGIDIRGMGGYIVVAPSSVKMGDEWLTYTWRNWGAPIAEAPGWALELVAMARAVQTKEFDPRKVMSGLPQGERDTELFRYACHLAGREVPYDMAHAFITVAADRCNPPFSHAVVEEKLKRAYSYPKTPRGQSETARKIDALNEEIQKLGGAI